MTPRRALSAIVLLVAMFAGSIAYSSFIARRVTNEPETVADAATEVVHQPVIRDQMIDEIAQELLGYIGPGLAQAASNAGIDPAAEARAIATAAVQTPEYEEAVYATLLDLHRMTFEGPQGKLFIDVAGVTNATRAAAIARNPVYGPMLPDDAELIVRSPITNVPDLTEVKDRVNGVFGWSLAIALVGTAAAFVLHDERYRVLRRIGFWAMLLASAHLFIGFILPGIADVYIDERDDVPIAQTLTHAIASFVRAPAIFMFVTGAVLVIASLLWPMFSRSRRWAGGGEDAGSFEPPQTAAPYPPNYPAAPPAATQPPPTGIAPVAAAPPTAAMPPVEIPAANVATTATPAAQGAPPPPPPPPRGSRPGDEAFAPPDDEPPVGDSVFDD